MRNRSGKLNRKKGDVEKKLNNVEKKLNRKNGDVKKKLSRKIKDGENF